MDSITVTREEYICKDKVLRKVFLAYVVLLIVQDWSLQLSFGTIARSPYFLLSPLVFSLITITSNKLYSSRATNYYLIYYGYSIVVTLFLIVYYTGFENLRFIYGENLVVKCIKNSIYNLIIIITLYNYYFIFRYSGLKFIEKILKVLVSLQLFIGYVQIVLPHAFDIFKTPIYQMTYRVSLLNTEPSTAFPQLVLCLLCYLVIRLYNNGVLKGIDYATVIFGFVLLMFIQSRGGIVVMLLCFMLILLFSKQTLVRRLQLLFLSLIFIIPTVIVIVRIIIPQLANDIENMNSVSTRSITILSSLKSLFLYPFGQGYGTYLITFPKLLNTTINNVIISLPFPISTWELDEEIATGRALTVKSGLLNEVLYTGWIIIIFYLFFFGNAYKRLRSLRNKKTLHKIFQYILIFVIANFLFVSSIETTYIAFLPFALLDRLARNASGINSNMPEPQQA